MRSAYGTQLAVLTDQLAQMCETAGAALEKATRSLLRADLALADRVIADHRKVAVAGSRVQATGYALLTRQAPVARDLRAIVSSIQIVADIERMHALALHVAQLVRRRHPRHVLPEEVRGDFAEMGRIALELVDSALQVIVSCDLGRARYIRDADDAMDDLHRHLFGVLLDRPWNHGTVAAIDVTLLSRYYERFADHAVEISRQVIFQATGQIRPRERMPVY